MRLRTKKIESDSESEEEIVRPRKLRSRTKALLFDDPESLLLDVKVEYSDDDTTYDELTRQYEEEKSSYLNDDLHLLLDCKKCDFTTKKAKSLMRHIQNTHSNDRTETRKKDSKRSIKKSYKDEDEDYPYNEGRFSRKKILKYLAEEDDIFKDEKIKEEKEDKIYKKPKEPKDEEWKNHMVNWSTEDEVILNCTDCEYTSNSERNLRRHIKRVHMGEKDYERGNKRTIAKAKKKEAEGDGDNDGEEESKQCPSCSYSTAKNKNLRKHISNMHASKEEADLTCDQCVYTTRNRRYLRRHIRENHTPGGEKKCTYEDCKYVTKRNDKLKRHIGEVHEGVRRDRGPQKKYPVQYKHQCDQCDYKASAPSTLRDHQKRVHLQIKDQACDRCDYKTTISHALKKHINFVHLKIREHACPKCGMMFTEAQKVRQHIKAVHDRIKDKLCPHCKTGFSARGNMIDHVRKVHFRDQDMTNEQMGIV